MFLFYEMHERFLGGLFIESVLPAAVRGAARRHSYMYIVSEGC